MKYSFLKSLMIIILTGMTSMVLTSCGDDPTDINVLIVAKYQADTNVVVPFADVVVGMHDVTKTGKTDATGEFETQFQLEAILPVSVSKDTNTIYDLNGTNEPPVTGEGTIRLRAGEAVKKTIFVN